jgi:hypothetical protein
MSFVIPSYAEASAAGMLARARWTPTDVAILADAAAGNGVLTGCAVTAQGTPNMTVAVAAGSVAIAATEVIVASGNVTVTTAHATLPRRDLVVVNASAVKSVVAGTAANPPTMPAIPASSVVLRTIYVPAADTAINDSQMDDRRVFVPDLVVGGGPTIVADYLSSDVSATSNTTLADIADFALPVGTQERWKVELDLLCDTGAGDLKFGWSVPSGTTVRWGTTSWADAGSSDGASWAAVQSGAAKVALKTEAQTHFADNGGLGAGVVFGVHFRGIVRTAGTAGTVQFRFAQWGSDGTASKVKADSIRTATLVS